MDTLELFSDSGANDCTQYVEDWVNAPGDLPPSLWPSMYLTNGSETHEFWSGGQKLSYMTQDPTDYFACW